MKRNNVNDMGIPTNSNRIINATAEAIISNIDFY
jgi:hypothetical protein